MASTSDYSIASMPSNFQYPPVGPRPNMDVGGSSPLVKPTADKKVVTLSNVSQWPSLSCLSQKQMYWTGCTSSLTFAAA